MLAAANACGGFLSLLLWVVAVVVVIYGIITAFRGEILWGIVLIILGLLIGPGGASFIC